MKRIAFVNQKGGVGKTTTAINLAGFLAQRGRDVLLVDLDPQGNATTGLGIDRDGILSSIYEVLMEGMPAANAIRPTSIPGLKMIPSSRHLPGCEIELTAADNREFRLFNALQGNLQPSTYILIDCPPSLGLLTLNGLVAAQSLIIPLQAEFFALEGLSQLLQTYHLVRANLNPTLHIEGILLTMYDNRTNLAREVEAEIVNYFSGRERVFKSKIPRNIRLAEAPSHGLPISHYAAGSLGALAYSELAEEVISSVEKNLLLKQDNDSPSTNHAKPFVASALAPNPPLDI